MGILDEIVAHKRIETQALGGQCWETTQSTRSLLSALSGNKMGLIAEVKKKSPTAGNFTNSVDIVARAKAYEAAGASAISVLTDSKYFGGSLADLRAIADAVTIPVLRKDFTVRVEQLYESRAHGADAVLLMAHVLTETEMREMLAVCGKLGLDALVETHDAESIEMAVRVGAKIIGVNARDFSKDDLPICPERFATLLPLIPDTILKIAESGMKTRADVARVEGVADGVLIGSALMSNGIEQVPATIFSLLNYKQTVLSPTGQFGIYGGMYVPEVLLPAMHELGAAFDACVADPTFDDELRHLYRTFAGRPTPLTFAENLTKQMGGARIFLKNEGLNHTGAHKMNHCIGQGIVAKRMGKKRVIAETGAGQHGVATATVCAKLGLPCTIYMGAKDAARQRPNVFWMEQMGATVVPVEEGDETLRDAVNAAMRELIRSPEDTHYLLGTVCGPDPYPRMNTYFQKIIGEETRAQMMAQTGGLPDAMLACVGGGSNAMGFFTDFLDEPTVRLIGVEAGGRGVDTPDHAARFATGRPGVAEGMHTYLLQDDDGQLQSTHSISAGLDYSGVGPQLSYLYDAKRLEMTHATDEDALNAFKMVAKCEGILPALESSHGIAAGLTLAAEMSPEQTVCINVSGRGEKDLFITAGQLDGDRFKRFLQNYIDGKL